MLVIDSLTCIFVSVTKITVIIDIWNFLNAITKFMETSVAVGTVDNGIVVFGIVVEANRTVRFEFLGIKAEKLALLEIRLHFAIT